MATCGTSSGTDGGFLAQVTPSCISSLILQTASRQQPPAESRGHSQDFLARYTKSGHSTALGTPLCSTPRPIGNTAARHAAQLEATRIGLPNGLRQSAPLPSIIIRGSSVRLRPRLFRSRNDLGRVARGAGGLG